MSKTNLQKLHGIQAGIRSIISMFIGTAQVSKEQLNTERFRLALEELEIERKTLYEVNEKIMSATDVEHIEEEMVTMRKESFKLKRTLMGLRDFQRKFDAKDSIIYRYSQTKQGTDGRFEEQISCDVTAESQNNSAGIDPRADGSRHDATAVVNCNVRRQAETQQMVNIQPLAGGSQDTIGNVSHTTLNSASYHRLPKLTLPTFNGDVQAWQTFWDLFESTVHQNINLTDVQRFSYLKSQLEGEAACTKDGFALTHTNYAQVVDLLRERYGQKHKIIHTTMQALLQLPISSSNLHSLRKFYDDMETKIHMLESLGKTQENYGDVLVPIVLEKLSSDIREHLARQHGDNDWLLSDLRFAIYKKINIKEAGASSMVQTEAELYGSTTSLIVGKKGYRDDRNREDSRQTLKCLLCGDPHVTSECGKIPDDVIRLGDWTVKSRYVLFSSK